MTEVKETRKMNNPIKIDIASQSTNGALLLIAHIDTHGIALRSSETARKIYQNNKDLFEKINENTSIGGGTVYRKNVVNSRIDYLTSEKEIANISIQNGKANPFIRVKNQKGTIIDVDPESLRDEREEGFVNNSRLSKNDLESMQKISEVYPLEISHSNANRVITFAIRDFSTIKETVSAVNYRIKIAVHTEFDEYIRFLLKKLDESILFVTRYISSIISSGDYVNGKFKKSFKKRIYSSLGIDYDSEMRFFLNDEEILNSDFGQIGLNLYNAKLLLDDNESGLVYNHVISRLIPSRNTNLLKMEEVKSDLSKVRTIIQKEFNIRPPGFGVSKIGQNSVMTIIESDKSNDFLIDNLEPHGYNIFTNEQDGLVRMTIGEYENRFFSEKTRYYQSLGLSEEEKKTSTPEFQRDFQKNVESNRTHLTPIGLVLAEKVMSTENGIFSMDRKSVQEFKAIKASRYIQQQKSDYKSSFKSDYSAVVAPNFVIANPVTSITSRSTVENVDPLIDSKYYVGYLSSFSGPPPDLSNVQKKDDRKAKDVIYEMTSVFGIESQLKTKSAKDIAINNPESITNTALSSKSLDIPMVPPQLRAMMTEGFLQSPNMDPLQNLATSAIIEETMANTFMSVKLVGFEMGSDGMLNLSSPIYQPVQASDMASSGLLIKAVESEVSALGMVKDNYSSTIYNNMIIVG